ncbi:SH2 domain-containing adapter protein D-like [Seriola lalandi dorsalis]|uniref:SH2 domain-containing adapter protein D-like n=1 Tax=Seriola lalandi dorsalis TaxID=1841481 RepID=UPI000C6F7B0E|nr:SH2 domain-containing adapter protein D-like [Seriola lalandi dorsalis]
MAKWLKDYLNFGSRRDPPQPPRPDYSESEILRAYRAQKELDFEDPYQHTDKEHQNGSFSSCSATVSLPTFPAFGSVLPNGVEVKVVSPKHRLIKVDSQEFGRCKIPLSPVTVQEEPVVPSAPAASDTDTDYSDPFDARPDPRARPNWEPKPAPTDCCSYMEPFEAQRIISENLMGWYHGALSRLEAETLLTLCKESSYLVRNSQTCRCDYSLSLRSCKGFMHMKFTQSADGRYVLGENSPPFSTIPEVIHYYTTHKLPIRGAEHMSLLYPVIVQTL